MTVRAIHENGVFRPTEPVDLPKRSEVEIMLPEAAKKGRLAATYRIMGEVYASGERDVPERHNAHQP